MVHGGTRSATNYHGTPDGREGWAQYFVRQGYAVYVVDQPGRGRSGYLAAAYGPWQRPDRDGGQRRYLAQEKYKLWPQAHLHTQWPGSGEPDDPTTLQMISGHLPEIEDFTKQQFLNRDALVALIDRIGPAILHGALAGRRVRLAGRGRAARIRSRRSSRSSRTGRRSIKLDFIGAPDYFKEGPLALPYGLTAVPLDLSRRPSPTRRSSHSCRRTQADGPGLARCWRQKEPARKLPNLKMPILVLTSEASYHAPYDHCTVKFLQQAGVKPTLHPARRPRHQGQQPRDDEREEQQGDRRRDRAMAREDAAGERIERRTTSGTPGRRTSSGPSARCA